MVAPTGGTEGHSSWFLGHDAGVREVHRGVRTHGRPSSAGTAGNRPQKTSARGASAKCGAGSKLAGSTTDNHMWVWTTAAGCVQKEGSARGSRARRSTKSRATGEERDAWQCTGSEVSSGIDVFRLWLLGRPCRPVDTDTKIGL
ncbi:hypothetical protein M6B38_233985 [Iris pallida]|uniref:Uncharacterized protein n=1 Tax=Iris pallida TaxID=29817 RepID=A0AAX6DQ91_IRIPA|nr:hypothetical protein M6B38_233985 [Iris pallida]